MYLRVLCAVFLLSVPLANCVSNSTNSTLSTVKGGKVIPTDVSNSTKGTVEVPAIDDVKIATNVTSETVNVTATQLSSLDKYLLLQRSALVLNAGDVSDILEESADVQVLTSDNYPRPYPVKKIVKERISVTNSTGINIVINDLDIDPVSDYIAIVPLKGDGSEGRPIILTGKLKQPLNIRSLGYTKANLVFEARTIEGHAFTGFSISYAPYGDLPPAGTQPPDVKLPFEKLQTSSKLLVVLKKEQTNTTWIKVKELFANSTNSYIRSKNLTLEQALPQNVTLTRVSECFDSWPNSKDCAEVEYAITLYNDTEKVPDLDPFLEDRTPREPAGLTSVQLEEMWEKFGRAAFAEEGIVEYVLPDTRTRILMWVGIAIGVVVLLFLIFVAVFRSPAFRDRWVEDDTLAIKNKEADENKGNYDITMYPSPDQVVPDMYPGGTNGQTPTTELGAEGRIRQNNFETINEGYVDDERPTTRIKSTKRTEQSQADAPV